MHRVLLAGGTGYLGQHIARELVRQGYWSRLIVRSKTSCRTLALPANEVVTGELTRADSLDGCCAGMDTVISTVGITRQREGFSYMDVDYQANLNLLHEATRSGVKKFIYVSVLKGDELTDLAICQAKERFVDALRRSGLAYSIIRPTGFFSDLSELLEMAKRGRVYLFDQGQYRSNPIHGADLAAVCVAAIDDNRQCIEAGGPEVLSHREMARLAFKALGREEKITLVPAWMRKTLLWLVTTTLPASLSGPMAFFLRVMAMDMVAPRVGEHRLGREFHLLSNKADHTLE